MKKKVRSKLMSMALVFTMAAGLLSGCGGNNVVEADKNTITIWHDKEDAVAEVLQKKLEELEPDVHVVLEKKSDLTESLKMIGSDPKAAPDMYFFAHDKIGVYAEMGILAPITDIIPKEELNVYMDNTLEAATYKGEIYQLPVYYETLLFMYNRRYMKDDEVPKTTEELYLDLLNRCPDIQEHITLKEVASFLQVTPETISRIRHKLNKCIRCKLEK